MEAMLHELNMHQFELKYFLDDLGHITTLFFVHPDSISLLKQYPDLLLMDCTYKTNRFHMPLLNIIGCTSLNRTFFTTFIFMSGETEKDYTSALKMLFEVLIAQEISYPKVIITDKDQSLMKAISFLFPRTINLLCDWHINKNVLSYAISLKLFEKGTDEEKDFMNQWRGIVTSKTVTEYEKRWLAFQKK